jgi:hypothetical protein
MGYRTVVMLNNDMMHEWANDAELGSKIRRFVLGRDKDLGRGFGSVVEVTHADTRTLCILDHYQNFTPVAFNSWPNKDDVALLKEAADKYGYRLVKKSK